MCAMLGLPQLQKTLNETTDLIHTRLLTTHRGLQITEKRVGIVHICIPVFISQIQKKKSISIQVAWCFPHINQLCSVFEIYLSHVPSRESPHQATLRPHMGTSPIPHAFSIQVPTSEPSVPSVDASSVLQFPDQSINMKGSIKMVSSTRIGIVILSMERWIG